MPDFRFEGTQKPGWYIGRYVNEQGELGGHIFAAIEFLDDDDSKPDVPSTYYEGWWFFAIQYFDGENVSPEKPQKAEK